MLNLYFRDDGSVKLPDDIIIDVEDEFNKTKIVDTELVRLFIQEIDQGTYLNEFYFTDRFGAKLPISNLSTGCKAAILVALEPSVCIDIRECGNNARDLIIKLCKNGSIALEENGIDYALDFDDSIDVCVGKYRFTTGYRLLKYMIDERGFEEYSDMSDVEMT